MAQTRHPPRPPDIDDLLMELLHFELDFVVVGSVAALFHGVDLAPGDLDIVPDPDPANLARLVNVLKAVEATPIDPGKVGWWQAAEDGEWGWQSRPATAEETASLLRGDFRADDLASLDSLFCTRHGNLDVVPRIAGEHHLLRRRAHAYRLMHRTVHYAGLADLLATLTVPRRRKDVERVRQLRRLQREADTD